MAEYLVIKVSDEEWQQIYHERSILIDKCEAVLSPDDLQHLNMWDAADEQQKHIDAIMEKIKARIPKKDA